MRTSSKRPVSERGRRRVAVLLGSATIVIVAGLVAFGAHGHPAATPPHRRARRRQDIVPWCDQVVKESCAPRTIELPAVWPRSIARRCSPAPTGYIAKRNVDIGSKVKQGDVLAVIAAPDLDQKSRRPSSARAPESRGRAGPGERGPWSRH